MRRHPHRGGVFLLLELRGFAGVCAFSGLAEVGLNLADEGVDGGSGGHLSELSVGFGFLVVEALADETGELKDLSDLLFGEEVDLQVEVIAGVDAPLHAVLLHEDKGAEEDAFDRDHHGEEDEGVGVEAAGDGDDAGVDQEPEGEDDGRMATNHRLPLKPPIKSATTSGTGRSRSKLRSSSATERMLEATVLGVCWRGMVDRCLAIGRGSFAWQRRAHPFAKDVYR